MPLPSDKTDRKHRPIARGCLDYFPHAIAEVAHLSFVANEQHNPGEPMHWAREKSADHADCIVRHLIDRGDTDTDGMRHSAKAAWRALAMLQLELEDAGEANETRYPEAPVELVAEPESVYNQDVEPSTGRSVTWLKQELMALGCPFDTAAYIAVGSTFARPPVTPLHSRVFYIAGPMRGYKRFNFPAFDTVVDDLYARGFDAISPADIDRAVGVDEFKDDHDSYGDPETVRQFVLRDVFALFWLHKNDPEHNSVIMLDGWEQSTGATAEFFLARWLGLPILTPDLKPLTSFNLSKLGTAMSSFLCTD